MNKRESKNISRVNIGELFIQQRFAGGEPSPIAFFN